MYHIHRHLDDSYKMDGPIRLTGPWDKELQLDFDHCPSPHRLMSKAYTHGKLADASDNSADLRKRTLIFAEISSVRDRHFMRLEGV